MKSFAHEIYTGQAIDFIEHVPLGRRAHVGGTLCKEVLGKPVAVPKGEF